jgi:hypothetical protein
MHFRLVKYYNLSSQAFQENIAIRGKTLKCLPLYLAIFLVSSNPEVDDWMRFFMCLIEKSQVPAFSLVDQLSAESSCGFPFGELQPCHFWVKYSKIHCGYLGFSDSLLNCLNCNLPASRGMINPDGTDIQVLHLYTSFMLCLPPA